MSRSSVTSCRSATQTLKAVSGPPRQIHWSSDCHDIEETHPEDIHDPGLYLFVPQKHDLDLGNRLVFRFVEDHLPDLYQNVRDIFRQKGAFSRFKDLLQRQGQLEAWHRYEERSTEAALREWCQIKELLLDQGESGLHEDPQVQDVCVR